MVTEDLAEWQYGWIEVRAKLPKGRGMWPAIWMLSESRREVGWPECGEIDIMEHVGYDNDTIHGTIHTKAYNHMKGTQKGKTIFIENPNDEFHVFAIEWTPEKIDFMLDGVVYNHIENEHKTTAEWPFDQKFYLILNVAVGGGWGGRKGIDESIFPQRMVVDYVRVFQLR
jgi:beta-glucanase (GH16 family)